MRGKEKLLKILKYLPLAVIIGMAAVLLISGKKPSIEQIVNYLQLQMF